MSKPFYSLEEVCERTGKTEEQIKDLVRDGELREFRDAGKIFFKAEDVDRLGGAGAPPDAEPPLSLGDTGEITLESVEEDTSGGDEDALPSLVDTSGGTSIIGLEPIEDEPAAAKKDDTVVSSGGIGVFDEDELEDADPMAKTQITSGEGGDQVSLLEGTGSGSGLLDLTREADDTSLGAELLDEIYPGEEEAEPAAEAEEPPPPPAPSLAAVATQAQEQQEEEAEEEQVVAPTRTATVVVSDPSEGLFDGMLVAALLLLTLAASVIAGALQGFLPNYAAWLSNRFLIFLGIAAGVGVVSVLIGWVVGRATSTRRA